MNLFTTDYERPAGMPFSALVGVSTGTWARGGAHCIGMPRAKSVCFQATTGNGQLSQRLGRSLT